MTPRESWTQERQPTPPNFGEAQRVSEQVLKQEVRSREAFCRKALTSYQAPEYYQKGLVSIVILTCQRPESLMRLVQSLQSFFQTTETYTDVEFVLVDNNSGIDVIKQAVSSDLFQRIISFETNLGMTGALARVYPHVRGEFILFVEDDFIIEHDQPFLQNCADLFDEFPEVGIIRLKDQNNWWKPYRRISPLRQTSNGTEFWTWLPSESKLWFRRGRLNGWTAGSVIFRKASYLSVGDLPQGPNIRRSRRRHQGDLYENVYGQRFNKRWLAAKLKDCYPFVQNNEEPECPAWGEAEA